MSASLLQFLMSLGLSKKETELFTASLRYGPQTANTMAKKIELPRSTVNFTFASLVKKGLILKELNQKTPYYRAVSVESIEYILMEKEANERKQLKELEDIMPLLKSFKSKNPRIPKIRSLEGLEGVRRTIFDVCEKDESVYLISSYGAMHPKIKEYIEGVYIQTSKNHKSKNKIIINDNKNSREYIKKAKNIYDEVIFVDSKEFPLTLTMAVYGNKTAIVSYDPEDMMGIIIENSLIADQMRKIFEILLENYRRKTGCS